MGSVRQDTISGIKWSAIEKIALQGIQFIIGIILARLLTPSDYGVLGMIAIFIAIANTFVDSGFSNALIRKKDRTQADSSTVFYFNIGASILCYIILFCIAPYVADFFKTSIICDVLRVISLTLVINAFVTVHRAHLTIAVDFKSLAKVSLVSTMLSGCIGIYFAYTGHGVWSLVYQQLGNSLISTLLILYISKWRPTLTFSTPSFKELGAYGSKLLVASLISSLYSNIVTMIIGKCYTAKDLGNYTRGNQFASLPGDTISGIMGRVTFPILAKIQEDTDKLIHVYRKYIRMTSMVIFFLMCTLMAVSKPLILILLSEKWADCIIYLQILCFAMMFDHITQINMNLLQVKGRSDLCLKAEIVKKILSTIIVVSSIPFGIVAVCVARVFYTQLAVAIGILYAKKVFGIGYWEQNRDIVGYLVFSVLSVLPALLLSETSMSIYITLPLGVVLSCALYFFFMRKDASYLEIKQIVLSIINKNGKNS